VNSWKTLRRHALNGVKGLNLRKVFVFPLTKTPIQTPGLLLTAISL
jgi:hypothetical protein